MDMTPQETAKLEKYMQSKFGNPTISLRQRAQTRDSVEVMLGEEFIGVIYKDTEDGELCFNFNMAILDIDLNGA